MKKEFFCEKQKKKKIDGKRNNNRLLISVNVRGSAGPLRFVVNEDDKVAGVIEMALKQYDRQGRLPVLGFDTNNFFLLPSTLGLKALGDSEVIGLCGVRNFILCKKEVPQSLKAQAGMIDEKRKSSGWKTWLNKSFSFKIHSH